MATNPKGRTTSEARARLIAAINEQGLEDDVAALAEAFRIDGSHAEHGDARVAAVRIAARKWGLDVEWFRAHIGRRLSLALGETPIEPDRPTSEQPTGAIHFVIAISEIGETPIDFPRGQRAWSMGRVLWPETRKQEIWHELRASFDGFWEAEVLPRQAALPEFTQRTRRRPNLIRDARAFAIRARLRHDGIARHADLKQLVADELESRYRVAVRDPESLDRAADRIAHSAGRSDI